MEIAQISAEVELRTQGLRPRTQNKFEAKAKDSPFEDRPSQGQAKDTGTSVLQKKKKGLQNFFLGDLQKRKTKKVFANFPQGFWRFPT